MAKLTYVIPSFQAAETLDQTVRSVLDQSERDVEALIVDDGSTDGTRHIAGALLGPRVRLASRPNGGLAAARNTGWAAVGSDLVCFLDADDVVAPSHAERMIRALGNSDAVACSYEFLGPRLERLGWSAPVLPSDTTHERLIEVNRLAIGGVVFRSSRIRSLLGGGFDESFPVHEDWEALLRLAHAGARWATPVEETLFGYRLRGGSLSADIGAMRREGVRVIERHAGSAEERSRSLHRWGVRAAARAIACGAREEFAASLAGIGAITETDLPTLVGTLRWAFARAECVGPQAWASRMPAWTERVRAMVTDPVLATQVMERLAFGPHRWREVVERARGMLAPGQSLVVYGFGRNGREALRAALDAGLTVAVVDDDARVIGKVPALRADELTPDHVVLVTPDARELILAKLAERGISRIILPEAA